MSGQTIAFVGVVYRVAVVGDRIAHAGAHRDDGESGDANGVAEPAFVQQHRVEVVEHLGGNAGGPLQHAAQIDGGIPVQERREGDVTVVFDVAAERKTKRGGRGASGEEAASSRTMRVICSTTACGAVFDTISVMSLPMGWHTAFTSDTVMAPS